MSEQRYSESELREVLRVASEEQSKISSETTSKDGYSRQDIERLAAEVGIDPQSVGVAINRLQSPSKSKWEKFMEFSLLDNSMGLSVTRTFNGPIDDSTWVEILSELRKIFRGSGITGGSEKAREWTCELGGIAAHAFVTQRDSSTLVRVEFGATATFQGQITSTVCAGIAFPLVFGSFLIWGSLQIHAGTGLAIGLTFGILALMLAFGVLFRASYSFVTKKDRLKVEALLDRIKEMMEES